MNSSGRSLAFAALLVVFGAIPASAQVMSQPTPAPIVTAGSEPWYLNGDPITFSGNFYYPSGAQVPFSPNEMVRSGFFAGVPLYTRTTDEPYSSVYVPVGRGFMQPYMRPRTGDVAGSAGTMTMGGAAARVPTTGDTTTVPLMQSGPPTLVAGPPSDDLGRPGGVIPSTAPRENTRPVGTSGSAIIEEPAPVAPSPRIVPPTPTRTRIGPRPQGLNAVFVEYKGRRWFAAGRAVSIDPLRMLEIGEHHGFTVYVDREKPEARLYIATVVGGTTATPYVRR